MDRWRMKSPVYSYVLDKHSMVSPQNSAITAPRSGMCKSVPEEDSVVETYDKHMTTSAFCFLYSVQITALCR